MAVAGIVLLAPNLIRLGRFLLGLPTGRPVHGRISSHRIVVAVTKWSACAGWERRVGSPAATNAMVAATI